MVAGPPVAVILGWYSNTRQHRGAQTTMSPFCFPGGYPASETEQWNVRKVQLVGLTKNPKPVVYDAAKVPGMKGVKDIPTRELDAFEKKALEALQSGDNLKVERHGAEMRVMGPIYSGKQCLACHDKPGEMLGAFTYVLERQPVKKPK